MKFLFGLPTVSGQYDIHVVRSIINQMKFIVNDHHAMECCIIPNSMIHKARNSIAQEAENYDYLFFIDSDCVIPDGALKRLYEYNKDIVSGMYFRKQPPFAPVIYRKNKKKTYDVILDYPVDKLIEVDGIGMGCCLIKSEVFKRIPEPFSPYKNIDGEDLAFCRKAQEKGYKIYVDTGIQAAHISPRYIDEDFYLRYMKKIMEENNGIDPTTGGSNCPTTGAKD